MEEDNEPEKSRVNVSVDNSGRSDVQSNSRALFTVPGYRESTIDVTESQASSAGISSEISKGTGARKVFMTPGKTFNREVKVDARYTWLGRLMDNDRRPLEGAIPLNVMSWTPLGRGNFTLETANNIKTLYVMKDNAYWQCRMNVSVMRDVIRYVGTTSCQRTELASLPAAEQKQAELMTAGMTQQTKSTAMNKE
ncbi:fimbrial outer membrane usher protein TcfC [Cedecea neteri]|uniref:Fimbrial outer membrane usher protein TcfC n=1 Tax=Cedecea neteri TaxID=158822 RepID=A0A2X2SYS1_9ENTR|nr:fimbrial outer membrane usher protein TcfC [Cedecea neteri]